MRRGIPKNTSGIRAVPYEGVKCQLLPHAQHGACTRHECEGNARVYDGHQPP